MVAMLRVAFAFVSANLAGHDTGVQLRVHQFMRRFRLARQNSGGRLADICAIEVRHNAPAKLLEMFGFTEAGIGAGGARLGAG